MVWLKKIGWWLLVAVTAGLALYLKGRTAGRREQRADQISEERKELEQKRDQAAAELEQADADLEKAQEEHDETMERIERERQEPGPTDGHRRERADDEWRRG